MIADQVVQGVLCIEQPEECLAGRRSLDMGLLEAEVQESKMKRETLAFDPIFPLDCSHFLTELLNPGWIV
ncbi:MAG: hypothetical protein H8E18_02290 [FCB group bacterium]|nr:hypothetical protein [FCB group bacterium]